MSTNQQPSMDQIDTLMEKAWVEPPEGYRHGLLDIPDRYGTQQARFHWIPFLLNIILILWGLGTVYLFKGLWIPALSRVVSIIQELPGSWGQWFTNPYTILFVLAGSAMTLGWLALEPLKIRSSH